GNAQFSEPRAIAFGVGGAIFVSDKGNNRLHKWGGAWEGPPTFISAFGATGTGNGQLNGPRGVAADGKGHVWVVDRANSRVEQFSEAGEYLSQFGTSGSGNGQLSEPWGIAVTSAGNLWVADAGNHRIEEFNSKGEFMQKFGTKATGASKGTELVEPEGIAVAPGGMLWVADNSGARIAEFRETVSSESERFVRNVTTTGTGNPGLVHPLGLAVDSSGNLWAADETTNHVIEYSSTGAFLKTFGSAGTSNGQFDGPRGIAISPTGLIYVADFGNNRVEVFNPGGEFLTKFGTAGTGNAQFSEPRAIAFGVGGAIFVSDKGNNRVHKWTQPVVPDPVATIEVKVDGKTVATSSGGCMSYTCTLARQWTLSSLQYLGAHSVTVTATSLGGLTTSKSLSINEQRDEAKPTIQIGGELANAPEGWVQQEGYSFTATGSDPAGYGVTSLVFKIDGSSVVSTTQSCSEGGCEAGLSKAISMAPYLGGSHEAAVIATDGAGNSATRAWTINVDPSGVVSTSELTSTFEAVETTSLANPIGSAEEESEYEGTQAGLSLETVTGALEARGGAAPTSIAVAPSNGFSITIPSAVIPDCGPAQEVPEGQLTAKEEEELPRPDDACKGGLPQSSQV
ncbi:MAG: NHL repeat-containing protein, partial [Thermoleophilia bacterium]